jgi:hypothetical protein
MKKIILLYNAPGYYEMGGGLQFEEFKTEAELDKRVGEIYNDNELIACGVLEVFTYKTVEVVTKIERE